MDDRRLEFVDFMRSAGVLSFGDFVTKSGRPTPYFVNTGKYTTGAELERLGSYYAATIQARFAGRYDVLFGPAYKGIPLVVATAVALRREHGVDVPIAFDRKEVKDHGEGGQLVGHALQDGERVLIVEDVTTAGTSIRETVPKLRSAANVRLAGLVVSVDRMERGTDDERTALQAIGDEYGMETAAIVTLDDLLEVLDPGRPDSGITPADHERLREHRRRFGPAEKAPSPEGSA